MDKSSKKQPVTLESLAQTTAAGFSTLDKKTDSKFGMLDKKIDTVDKKIDIKLGILDKKIDAVDKKIYFNPEKVFSKKQTGFLGETEGIERVGRRVAGLAGGQAGNGTNLTGGASNLGS